MTDMTVEQVYEKKEKVVRYRPQIISPEGRVERWQPYVVNHSTSKPAANTVPEKPIKPDINNPEFRAQVDANAQKADPNVSTHSSRTHDAYEE